MMPPEYHRRKFELKKIITSYNIVDKVLNIKGKLLSRLSARVDRGRGGRERGYRRREIEEGERQERETEAGEVQGGRVMGDRDNWMGREI